MDNPQTPDPKTLDDRLADYTDRLLAAEPGAMDASESTELGDLAHTVRQLKKTVDTVQPDQEMKQRIAKRLETVFKEESARRQMNPARRNSQPLFSILAWGLVGVSVFLFAFAVMVTPLFNGSLVGTVGGEGQPGAGGQIDLTLLLTSAALVMGAVFLLWLSKHRNH